jgi:hypothetical protein
VRAGGVAFGVAHFENQRIEEFPVAAGGGIAQFLD